MKRPIFVHEFAIACPLGASASAVRQNLLSYDPPTVTGRAHLIGGRNVPVGSLPFDLEENGGDESRPDSRCNRIARHCLDALQAAIEAQKSLVGPERIAVVVGTCTSGVGEAGAAFRERLGSGLWPETFRYSAKELGDTADYVARQTGARGPSYGVSTACTSGAKAMASAARLIAADLCDVAVAGGIDSLCELTLNGFGSLELLSDGVCNPFSRHRRGTNLGEGGALFILSTQPSAVRLTGIGESADAYHISAPDPEGKGAEAAMRQALDRASVGADAIDYLNLHGTATKLNDVMEAKAIARVFGQDLPCSSTKPMTGHLLGAAGSCEAAFAIMALQENRLPAHIWDGERDEDLPPIRLVDRHGEAGALRRVMSCSYAFGGNNIALIFERAQ